MNNKIEEILDAGDQIDFSKYLRTPFHATLDQSQKVIITEGDDENKLIKEDLLDISLEAGIIVSSALHRTLYCPFCADEFIFEFILKDHLKSKHYEDIKVMRKHDDRLQDDKKGSQGECPYCKAFFAYSTLVPKHIAKVHGKEQLDEYLTDESENLFQFQEKEIRFVTCSPGLSELFNDMDTCDSIKKLKRSESSRSLDSNPQLKSILKKTSNSPRIFFSPASASIRRTRENIKRSASARRELRFDLPPLPKSPDDPILPPASKVPHLFKNSDSKFFNWNLFTKKKHVIITKTSPVKKKIKTRSCKSVCHYFEFRVENFTLKLLGTLLKLPVS